MPRKGHENDPAVFKVGETALDTTNIHSWSMQMPPHGMGAHLK
ncbi:MAG: hypothetical protein BWY09_00974 [Candidatus Hydrogenedentes bacterium ADurb.Bin179]|nr:MAG: hypothetical protein BWY09_00974 [Candidatus Hydrogenedentes bacterium ADurb.Bin179]